MGKKLTLEYVREEIEKVGYKLLSNFYDNNQSILNIRCNKGHIYKTNWANFRSGCRCSECATTKKLTLTYVKEEISKYGYKCLSTEYVNSNSMLDIQCDKGHFYQATWEKFNQGRRCPICSGRNKWNIDKVKETTREKAIGYVCLSEMYINTNTKLKFKCDKGHEYKAIWSSFLSGARCLQCACNRQPTIEEIQEKMLIIASTYKCLSTNYINAHTKLEFECDKGHQFKTLWGSFYGQGTRCPICAAKQAGDAIRFTIEFVKSEISRLTNNKYECLSNEYYNNFTELVVKCDRKHIFKTNWSNFQSGYRCPECAIINKTKYTIEDATQLDVYRLCVKRFTDENYRKYYYLINPNKLSRTYEEYHLDHIYSVSDGFNNGVHPKIIANPTNLQMLSAFENQSKNGRSDMTKDELFRMYKKFIDSKGEPHD